jgi:tetratricopeptide (TPR) repeat protein
MRGSSLAAAVMLFLVATNGWAQTAGANRQRAKELFRDGVEAYDQGRYDQALTQFQKAHALSHSASLYFNMAACEEHLDHFHSAAVLLRQYLLEKPAANDRGNVELRIQSLEEREAQQRTPKPEPAPPPVVTPPAPVVQPAPIIATPVGKAPADQPRPKLKYTWVLLGVTGAAAIAAVGVGAYTVVHHDDLKKGCGATAAGCSDAQVSGLKSTAVATDVLIGVAAAAAVATVVVGIVEARRGRSAHASAGRFAFRDGAVSF